MTSYRKTAIIIGILFLVCTAATLLSYPFSGTLLDDENYLAGLAGHEHQAIIGAFIEFIWAAAGAGIAFAFYPVLRKYNEGLALGSVGLRLAEGIFVLIGTACLLSLLTLSQDLAAAGGGAGSSFEISGSVLLSVRDWSLNVISSVAFALGALLYYIVLYTSKLIPRWLSGWGVLAAVLSLVATIIATFTGSFDTSSVHTYLNIPIGVNEIVLALWLIIKGFKSPDTGTISA